MPQPFRYDQDDEIEMYWAEQYDPNRYETPDTSVLHFQRDLEGNPHKTEQLDSMWNQYQDVTPSQEEMEMEKTLELNGLQLLWFQTDFRDCVKIILVKK